MTQGCDSAKILRLSNWPDDKTKTVEDFYKI